MEVNKKRLSEIFGVSVRTIQNWQDQGMPVARGGGKGNEVLYESSAAIEWYSARDAAIENEKLRKEVRYIAAGLGVSYEQLSRNYSQMSYSTARASANESWAYFMGRRKFVASRQACQMFLCWLEEAIVRRVVTLPSKARFRRREAPGEMQTGSAPGEWPLTV